MSKLTIKIGASISGLKAGLSKAKASMKKFVGNIRSSMGGLAGAFGAMLSVAGVKRGIDALDDIGKTAGKIGVSTAALQKYNYIAQITGTSQTAVATSFKRMASVILDAENGLTESKRALADLNLKWEDLARLKPEKQFEKIVDALNNVDDASRRNALAQDIFGRGGQELQIFIRDFKELSGEIESMGAIIPESTIRNAEKLNDAITRIKTNWAAAIGKGVELAADVSNGDVTGETRLRKQKMKNIRGMAKDAAKMGDAGLASKLFQTADSLGSASSEKELIAIVRKYRSLKKQFNELAKQKRQEGIAEKKRIAGEKDKEKADQKALDAAMKQIDLEEAQEKKIRDQVQVMEDKLKIQKLINAGKGKEAAIEQALANAKRSAGRDLTDKEKTDISKAAGDLYSASNKKEANKNLLYDRPDISDSLRRIGGNIGGAGAPDLSVAKDSNKQLKSMDKYLASIDEKTELTFDNDSEMKVPA